jgi:hypothetical protein
LACFPIAPDLLTITPKSDTIIELRVTPRSSAISTPKKTSFIFQTPTAESLNDFLIEFNKASLYAGNYNPLLPPLSPFFHTFILSSSSSPSLFFILFSFLPSLSFSHHHPSPPHLAESKAVISGQSHQWLKFYLSNPHSPVSPPTAKAKTSKPQASSANKQRIISSSNPSSSPSSSSSTSAKSKTPLSSSTPSATFARSASNLEIQAIESRLDSFGLQFFRKRLRERNAEFTICHNIK